MRVRPQWVALSSRGQQAKFPLCPRSVSHSSFAKSPRSSGTPWQRRTNVWRKGTRFARGLMLPTSNRQRGAIFWASPTGKTPLRGQCCWSSPLLTAGKDQECEPWSERATRWGVSFRGGALGVAQASSLSNRCGPIPCSSRKRSGLSTRKKTLFDNGVNAPISIHHLGHPEINGYRDQRDCLGDVVAEIDLDGVSSNLLK